MDRTGKLFIFYILLNVVYKIEISTDGVVSDIEQLFGPTITAISNLSSVDMEYVRPILFYKNNTIDLRVDGEFFVGYGDPITINDIRFKTKPTKEVVTWDTSR